jgi:glycosyltransferase involved in cell wall biosynthesis
MAQDTGSAYSVSVCLASYNGEKFIREQIESILSDLKQSDQLVICDDGSTDRTCSIIQSFNDARITLIHNKKNLGYARNFEKLISLATGDYIFLADQDNIWLKGKVQKVLSVFEKDSSIRLVCHNLRPVDASGNDFKMNIPFCREGKINSFILLVRHFIKAQFYGCTFCLNRRGVNDLLPFPSSTYAHDHWIIIWAAVNGHVSFLDEALIKYRRHDANISRLKRFPYTTILLLRHKLLLQICTAMYRRLHYFPFPTLLK